MHYMSNGGIPCRPNPAATLLVDVVGLLHLTSKLVIPTWTPYIDNWGALAH